MVNSSESPGRIRIWKFNTNEWIDYADFLKQYPKRIRKNQALLNGHTIAQEALAISPKKKEHG